LINRALKPASALRASSTRLRKPDSARIGMLAPPRARKRRTSSKPFMSGKIKSWSTSAGSSRSTAASAERPSPVSTTL
jgi:hypothetical protein